MDSSDSSRLLLAIHPLDHAHGPEDAPYTLVEYGDYECPDCGRLYVILRDLQRDIGSRLRIVFRHYPLSGIHHHAQQAAEAAEAAGSSGKFWEMHAVLFERQGALHAKDLIGYAENLGLRFERFRNELKNQTYSDIVRADFIAGVQNGVYRTPGLFLNGVRYDASLGQRITSEPSENLTTASARKNPSRDLEVPRTKTFPNATRRHRYCAGEYRGCRRRSAL